MVSNSAYVGQVLNVAGDPTRVLQLQINTIAQAIREGTLVFDVTSPFSLAMECMAFNTHALMVSQKSISQKLYPSSADTLDDIYRHAADHEIVGLYSTAAVGEFMFAANRANIINGAVPDEDNPQIRKIIIPRYQVIGNGVDNFTLMYPIVIKIMPDLSIQAYYDTSVISPLQVVENSFLPIRYADIGGQKYLSFFFSAPQCDLVTHEVGLTPSIGTVKKEFILTDRFFHCRAYIKNTGQLNWTEVKVANYNSLYDASVPTFLIKVLEGRVSVELPVIYSVNGLVNDAVRIDIFSTRGKLDYVQSGFSQDAFTFDFPKTDYNQKAKKYGAPLQKFDGIRLAGIGAVTGGTSGLTFAEAKKRIVYRSEFADDGAITFEQVRNKTYTSNFDISLVKDNVSDRIFLATKQIPAKIDGFESDESTLVSGVGIGLCEVNNTLLQMASWAGTYDNQIRVTITPKTLFSRVNGSIYPVSAERINALKRRDNSNIETVVDQINAEEFLFSPFYYRISSENQMTRVDVYDFDRPVINTKQAIAFNDAAVVMASTGEYTIRAKPEGGGYHMFFELYPDETLKKADARSIFLQASFIPDNGGRRVFLTAELLSGFNEETYATESVLVYRFDIPTTYDVDLNHRLMLTNDRLAVDLTKTIDLAIVVETEAIVDDPFSAYFNPSDLAGYLPTKRYIGVTREQVNVTFGVWLKHYWQRYRSLPEATQYLRYEADVFASYDRNIYSRDDDGNVIFTERSSSDRTLVPVILHQKGDLILDEAEQPIIRFARGSVIMDEYGNPIAVEGQRGIKRHFDIVLFDGKYYFADDEVSATYFSRAKDLVLDWVTNDGPRLLNRLQERTDIMVIPKVTMGDVMVTADSGDSVRVKSAQSVTVDIYMTGAAFLDNDIRQTISATIPPVISQELSKTTVSKQSIESAIRSKVGDGVVSVRISGLFDDLFDVATLQDNSSGFTIGARVTARSNKTLSVENTIDINFHSHSR